MNLREFSVIPSRTVMHCCEIHATGAPTAFLLLQQVTTQRPNFEPGGREFETLRARHFPFSFRSLAGVVRDSPTT